MTAKTKERLFKAGISLASFGVCLVLGSDKGISANMVSILGGLAGNWLAQFSSESFIPYLTDKWLSNPEPKVNHYIKNALVKSFRLALKDLQQGYEVVKGGLEKRERDSITEFFDILLSKSDSKVSEELNEELHSEEVFKYMEGTHTEIQDLLNKKLDFESYLDPFSDELYITSDFISFFKEKLPERMKLHFLSELKKGEEAKQALDILYQQTIKGLVTNITSEQIAQRNLLSEIVESLVKGNYQQEDKEDILRAANLCKEELLEKINKLIKKGADDVILEVIASEQRIVSKIDNQNQSVESISSVIENITIRMSDDQIYQFTDIVPYSKENSKISYKKALQSRLENPLRNGRVTSLQGMPGVGKSFLAQEVAFQYAVENKQKRLFDIVWWISSEKLSKKNNDIEANLNEDIKLLAKNRFLNIDITLSGWFQRLKSRLSQYSFLLVFDNACDIGDGKLEMSIQEFRETYFPPAKTLHQQLIVTSRNKAWGDIIEMETWSIHDFETYLKQCGIASDNRKDLKLIFEKLEGLPLAISLAAAYIIENQHSLKTYAKLLTQSTSYSIIQQETSYRYRNETTIKETFEISYSALNRDSILVLNQLVFLAPDNIPVEELMALANENYLTVSETSNQEPFYRINIEKSIYQLSKYGLIKRTSEDGAFSIHRLLKQSILEMLSEQELFFTSYVNIIRTLELATSNFDSKNYNFYRKILSHIEDFSTNFPPTTNTNVKRILIKLLRSASKYSFEIGAVTSALRLNNKVRSLTVDDLKLTHEMSLENAHSLRLQDNWNEAMQLAKSAHSYFSNEYIGIDKLKWVEKSRQYIGKVYQRIGLFSEAKERLELCEKHIRPLKDELIGKELYSGILHDLGSIWWEEGKEYSISIEYFDEAIKHRLLLKNGDSNDLYLNISKMIKGVVLGLLGKYEEQFYQHTQAFNYFSSPENKDHEYRRSTYTAYYLLHFGWDRVGWEKRNTEESLAYKKYMFIDADANINLLEGDIKYLILRAVLGLRQAVRSFKQQEANEHYLTLLSLLKEKHNGNRYLDDGTVSVSAVLDYARYLEEQGQITKTKEVIKVAFEMLLIKEKDKNIKMIYNRSEELESLYFKYAN